MEVGAVKQAFNNELILLKKKLNQAKIQIIHKLTRKAKTFTEKKAPEHIKEKLKRKAESAINEVLILKKIKPKDVAKFAITHKGKLNDHLNKPNVNQDKACARLLLHKSLLDKYNLLRTNFASIPIEDLLMSREERRKAKKEAREKRKKKGKDANKIVNAEGDWDVEDIDTSDKVRDVNDSKDMTSDIEKDLSGTDDDADSDALEHHKLSSSEDDKHLISEQNQSDNDSDVSQASEEKNLADKIIDDEPNDSDYDSQETNRITSRPGQFVKLKFEKIEDEDIITADKIGKTFNTKVLPKQDKKTPEKKACNKNKQSKNKNLNEKLLSRKFKKDSNDSPIQETSKIVDPFFITSTGENYMSVVEPRQPDEVKEVHKQGNRKLRRAVMFGHVPKIKPRQDNFRTEDNSFDRQNGFNKKYGVQKFNNKKEFNDQETNFTDKRNRFNRIGQDDAKPEKLHPSWEAKKRQSGILPFQGKKIVFDDS